VTWERPGENEQLQRAAAAIVAVPAVHVPALLPQLASEQRAYLSGVKYARSMVVTLLLARAPAERSMWLTVPDQTHPDVNVMILDHNKAPGRVPAGGGLVTVYWHRDWATARWELGDDEIVPQAIAAAEQVLPDIEGQVVGGYVWRWDPCTVARPTGGFRELAAFNDRLDPVARIQLAGDYFTITTVDSSVRSGEQAATRTLRALSARRD
jgi:oxygen-dependent protoporphyrinogen oxidase